MTSAEFFESPEEQSIVKTEIVSKYFGAWSKIMLRRAQGPSPRIAYIDLFSGPGKYEDGSDSTPLRILKDALNDGALRARLVTMFNDKNPQYARSLQEAISALPGIDTLSYRPQVSNVTVGRELVNLFRGMRLVPTLFFIDPWGYKGLSLDLIGAAVKDWGCDCIFFFNYNRIGPAISNPFVLEPMRELFGSDRADHLRTQVEGLSSDQRQETIVNALAEALKEVGGRFVLPFEFKSPRGDRTSHYVVFVSKHFLGYHLMKEVMFGLSSDPGEVRRFEYAPVKSPHLQLLFSFATPHRIDTLKDLLIRTCTGRTQTVWQIYEDNTVDTPYTLANVQDAIIALEAEGRVGVDRPATKRMRKGIVTLGKDRVVSFPA